jgi:hypothetical protein
MTTGRPSHALRRRVEYGGSRRTTAPDRAAQARSAIAHTEVLP